MPAPIAIFWALVELAAAITTAKEVYDLLKTLDQTIEEYTKNLGTAKEKVKEAVEKLKKKSIKILTKKPNKPFSIACLN